MPKLDSDLILNTMFPLQLMQEKLVKVITKSLGEKNIELGITDNDGQKVL